MVTHIPAELSPMTMGGRGTKEKRREDARKCNTAPVVLIHDTIYRNPVEIKGFLAVGTAKLL